MGHSKKNHLYALIIAILVLSGNVHATDKRDFTYSVISESEMKDQRHTIEVRLSKKISEQDLRSLAMELKKSEKKSYERTFIMYLLPGMKVGSGAWATTHFNPDLEVHILGLTVSQEQKMAQDVKSESRDVVGIWADERPYVGAKLTLFRDKGKVFLETKYADGSESLDEMIEAKGSTGTKLVEKGGNEHGEYLVLDRNGNLRAGGGNGIFLTYKKLK
jgi:hypothetical protein